MNVANLVVELDLDSGKFTGRIGGAANAVQAFSSRIGTADQSIKRIERSVSGFGASLRGLVVTLGQARGAVHTMWDMTGRWAGAIIKANAELERQTALLGGLSRATSEAGRMREAQESMGKVLNFARSAPFAIGEIGNAFVKMKSAGIDPVNGSMQSLLDSVAAFGGDDQTFHRATIAIQQMAGKGVISMEELRQQLGEAVPSAMNLMARSMGISVGQLVKHIATGKVEAQDALRRLFTEMSMEFGGSAQRMMSTWNGLVSQLKTEWMVFAKDIGGTEDSGFFAIAKDQLKDLIEALKSNEGRRFAQEFGAALADVVRGLAEMLRWLIRNRELLADVAKTAAILFGGKMLLGFVTGAVQAVASLTAVVTAIRTATMAAAGAGGLTAAITGVRVAMMGAAGPIGILAAGLGFLAVRFYEARKEAEEARQSVKSFLDTVANGQIASIDDQVNAQAELSNLRKIIDMRAVLAQKLREAGPTEKYGATLALAQANNLSGKAALQWARDMGLEANTSAEALALVRKRIGEIESSIRTNKNARAASDAMDAASTWGRNFEQGLAGAQTAIGKRVNAIYEQLNTTDPARKITAEQAKEARAQAITDEFDVAIATATKKREELQERLDAEPNNVRADGWRKVIAEANAAIGEGMRRRDEMLNDLKSTGPKLLTDGPATQEEKKKSDELMKFYDSVTAKVAGLKAKLEDANPSLAKFKSLLEGGSNKFGEAPNAAIVAQIEAQLREAEALEQRVKQMNARENAGNSIQELQARIAADIQSMAGQFSGDIYDSAAAGMTGLNRQIAEIETALTAANIPLEEFKAKFAKLREEQAKIDAGKFTAELRQMTQDIRGSLIRDPRERAAFDMSREIARVRASVEAFKGSEEQRMQIAAEAERYIQAVRDRYAEEAKTGWERMLEDWADVAQNMDSAMQDSMNNVKDAFWDVVETGKFSFSSLVEDILKNLLKVATNKMWSSIFSGLMSSGSGGGNSWMSALASAFGGGGTGFAKGGVMTGAGPVPLRGYANGGIANSPQLALFGEGSMPEAYVPLPDGRRIPVSMDGSAAPPVTVNVINQSGTQVNAEQSGGKFDGKQFVLDVVLTAVNRPGSFRDTMRGAMR